MSRRFVIEAVLVAIYGQLLVPSRPVEYLLPYSTIQELYEMRDSDEPVMPDPQEDAHVKSKIGELIAFFEEPFNRKKLERALQVPWRKSPPFPISDNVTFIVVNTLENAQYGERFDPIETELVLLCMREQAPMLTDQFELEDKIIEAGVPVQLYDVEDFDFALEGGISEEDLQTP
ncbi:hypothetical protein J31TS4_05540 [Paenibacillus sp. J31TS4]|uniref:ADP-heptose synthase n=1 Tax=Paenibacillus sp. J31TS4 TaxID=2807195 RepID=UPI001B0C27D9|nr:ADP-heptose synthase [Paenibacillus sp. J31TS4]GIP37274.1 hypothetical protein J31TS4_05540 [Paenibacillus sp. J31TS4]